jgi:hypothetical protein
MAVRLRTESVLLYRALKAFTAGSVRHVLFVAASSPGAVHRLPSLRSLWLRSVLHLPSGLTVATSQSLTLILDAAFPDRNGPVEDWWPPDPRHVVCVRVGDLNRPWFCITS